MGGVLSVVGGLLGFYVAGYTGVLLAVTNRPIWSDSPLLGMLFVVSAASISAALMILLADRYRWTMPGLSDLHRMDSWIVMLEFLVLIAFLATLGPVFRAWLSAWGLLLLFGVVGLGMLVPLALSWRKQWLGDLNITTVAALVLLGGFLLRVVIVFAAEESDMNSTALVLLGGVVYLGGCASPEGSDTHARRWTGRRNRTEIVRMHDGSNPYEDTPRFIGTEHPSLETARQAYQFSRR